MQMPMPWETADVAFHEFEQDRIHLPDIEAYNGHGGLRYYVTPAGDLPSVTSVIGAGADKSWLEEWRSRIGHDKAAEITRRAAERGERMHNALEARLANDRDWLDQCEEDPEAIQMAESIANGPLLSIDRVIATETPLWCEEAGTAGRVDNVSIHEGELSIVDFKNSRRYKRTEDIGGYFTQAGMYARLLESRTGLRPKKIVIMMAMAEDYLGDPPLVFTQRVSDWIKAGDEALARFRGLCQSGQYRAKGDGR